VNKTNLFLKWYDNLKDKKLQLLITRKIERIKNEGYFGKTYPIAGVKNISEIKFETGAGYRIYFNIYANGNEVWFLTGGDKSAQKRDIEMAKLLLEELQKEREKENGKDYDYER
jgi:putative addiction module killer protein